MGNHRTDLLRLREPDPLRLRPGGEVPKAEVPLPPLVLRGGAGDGRDQEAVQHRGRQEEAEHADRADLGKIKSFSNLPVCFPVVGLDSNNLIFVRFYYFEKLIPVFFFLPHHKI